MNSRILLLALLLLPCSATAGDDKATARLKDLQTRVAKQDYQDDKLRRELLAFARDQVGTPLYAKAIDALRPVPAPLDRLDEKAIEEDQRRFLSIRDLVAFERPNNRAIASIAISFDGALLATSGWDNVVHVSKLGAKEPKSWAKLEGSPSGIAFSADSKWLATGCADTHAIIWDVTGEKPKEAYKLGGHKSRPFAVAFPPRGPGFASACAEPVLRLWKLEDLTPEVWTVITKNKAPSLGISSLAFSHDGKFLVAGSMFGKETLRIWDASGASLAEKTPPAAQAKLIACSPTEPILAFAGDDGVIHLWDLGKAPIEKLRTIDAHFQDGKKLPPIIKALAFSPDGKTLASSGQDKRVRIWDVATGVKRREWQFLDEARAMTFSSDGRHLAIGNSDGTMYLLRLDAAQVPR
jgi:WD40 repeat protein